MLLITLIYANFVTFHYNCHSFNNRDTKFDVHALIQYIYVCVCVCVCVRACGWVRVCVCVCVCVVI